jgi:glycosyltransferase involved in cell wall biosynthesis
LSRSLTVVIPVFNEEHWIGQTLEQVARAAERAPSLAVDVVVVDDGSTDATRAVAEAADVALPVRVVTTANQGRHLARSRGLDEAEGELVLFLDGRVTLDPGSLEFVAGRLAADPDDTVWNAHVEIDAEGNPYGRFWNVLTELAFSEYFAEPRTTSFGPDEFEAFPKGTTCFLAPKSLLEDAIGGHESYYEDPRNANDDTPMIRRIAARHRIGISPSFSCVYQPRKALGPFARHAYHRGVVFLDGHGRRGARLLPAVVAFYPVSAAVVLVGVRKPWVVPALLLALGGVAGTVAALKGRPRSETLSFAALTPVYGVAHGLGMWRGAILALTAARRRS